MRFVRQQRRFRSSMCARSDPRTTFDLVEGVESLYGYRPGGYHPVIIRDSFRNGRYTVVHKLGHGTYSTVWLARDNQTRTCVAIKIGIAAGGPSRDIGILKLLAQSDGLLPPHPGRNAIPPLLDSFVVSGPFAGPHVHFRGQRGIQKPAAVPASCGPGYCRTASPGRCLYAQPWNCPCRHAPGQHPSWAVPSPRSVGHGLAI
ncbi:hypothetical protein RB594_007928 [Gaeumannomyces avenae]